MKICRPPFWFTLFMRRIICFCLSIAMAFTLFQERVFAEGNIQGLSISPMFQEVSLDANNKDDRIKTFPIDVSNTTDSLITLRLSLFDFGSLDESGGVAFLGAEENFEKKYSLASWMSLDRDAIALGPGEKQTVIVSVENRESLSPGGHYGAIIFKTEKNSNESNEDGSHAANIAVNQSFASLIFVKKVNGAIYDLALKDYEMKKNWFQLSDTLRIRFQNKGNTHVVPRGLVTIADPLNRMVKKGVINPESAIILPEIFRTYPVEIKSVARAFIPGWYTISIQHRYDGKDDFTVQSESFFYIPPIVIFVPVIIGLLVLVLIKRKRTK